MLKNNKIIKFFIFLFINLIIIEASFIKLIDDTF